MPQPQVDQDVVAALLAIPDPLERAARITDYGRTIGTLPPDLARQRRHDIAVSRLTHSASKIAARLRMARSGIFRITNPRKRRGRQVGMGASGEANAHVQTAAPTSLATEVATA